jgi:glycosyltransferase involved in cell wall biosynthesis
MRIVQITTDNREAFKDYSNPIPHFGAAPEALLEGFKMFPKHEIHVISCSQAATRSPEKLADNIWFHQPVVPKLGWGRTFYSGCVSACRSLIRHIDPDIVHGQGTERECAISAVYAGYPNVLTIHGNMAEIHRLNLHGSRMFGMLASFLENHALKKTAGVFCNSVYTRSLVAPRANRTWDVPNAIRSAFFRAAGGGCRNGAMPVILNVGVVGPRKRQLEILQIVRKLADEGVKLKIVFIGDLPEHTEYARNFKTSLQEAEGYASFAGFLQTEQLVDLMDDSDGFIHFPSEEAFGLVVAEALARGLKFFGSDLGGIRDICAGIPGTNLCKSFDELESDLREWISNGHLTQPRAAESIANLYKPEIVAKRHLEIYQEVIDRI